MSDGEHVSSGQNKVNNNEYANHHTTIVRMGQYKYRF